MRRMIREAMEDRPSPEAFRFSLNCAVCGAAWISRTSRFSKAGVTPESEGKRIIFQKLYEREWEEARERAVTDAMRPSICAPSAGGWCATAASCWVRTSICVPTVPGICRSGGSR